MSEGSATNETEDQLPDFESPADIPFFQNVQTRLKEGAISGKEPVDPVYLPRKQIEPKDAFIGEFVPEVMNTGRGPSKDFGFLDSAFAENPHLSSNFNFFDTPLEYPYQGLQTPSNGDLELSNDFNPSNAQLDFLNFLNPIDGRPELLNSNFDFNQNEDINPYLVFQNDWDRDLELSNNFEFPDTPRYYEILQYASVRSVKRLLGDREGEWGFVTSAIADADRTTKSNFIDREKGISPLTRVSTVSNGAVTSDMDIDNVHLTNAEEASSSMAARGSEGDPDGIFASSMLYAKGAEGFASSGFNFKEQQGKLRTNSEPESMVEESIDVRNEDFDLFDGPSQESQPVEALEEKLVSFMPLNSSKMDFGGDDSQSYMTAYSNGPTPSEIFGSPLFNSAQSSPWNEISTAPVGLSPLFHSAQGSPWNGKLPLSMMSSPIFYSATSSPYVNAVHESPRFVGAQDGIGNHASSSDPRIGAMAPPPKPKTEYMKAIQARGLVLPLDQELNWSGKPDGGQHVEFAKGEELPFKALGTIGASLTATVDKVRCRRILLARKTMLCGRRISLHDALAEVEHLQKLRHPHIIQLVGSYLQGKRFSVLLYPVADYDLGKFLERVSDYIVQSSSDPALTYPEPEVQALSGFFGCLTDALQYIHSKATRHLDIKPGNILVKRGLYPSGYRVYIADFGISKSFSSLDHSQTDDPILRTPKYCAPEVWERDTYGRAADIFSLGCVFTEMLTTLAGQDLDEFADFRSQGGEGKGAFRESLSEVTVWMRRIRVILDKEKDRFPWSGTRPSVDVVLAMLEERPERRRLWEHIRGGNQFCSFCKQTREAFREEPSEEIGID